MKQRINIYEWRTRDLRLVPRAYRDDGSETPVKVEEPFMQNTKAKIVALMPDSIVAGVKVKICIITDYSGSGTPLKASRTLDFGTIFMVIIDAVPPGPAPAP
jgi:hypothetical protein